jgi:ribose transport system substrate-binding protein
MPAFALPSRYAALALVAGAALVLAGCSGSAAPAESEASSVDTAACVTAAEAAVDAARAPLDLIAPESPLAVDGLKGKTIWFVTSSVNQWVQEMLEGVEEAAAEVGAEVKLWDAEGTINKVDEGVSQAVAQNADAIMLIATDPSLISGSLPAVQEAGIPILDVMSSGAQAPVPDGFIGSLTSDFAADGATGAMWALADSGCAADLAVVEASVLPIWHDLATGALDTITETCDTCAATSIDIDLANLSTDLPSQVQTALQRDPDINYIFAAWDSAVPLLSPVLAASATAPTVMGRDGIEASLQAIAAGDGDQSFTLAMPPTQWTGWTAFDMTARAILGETVPTYVIPTRLIDATNVEDGSVEAVSPNYVDFQDAFIAAWNNG